MFCRNCGKEISDNAYVCPYCGVKVAEERENATNNTMAVVGFVLSFLIPIAGLIVSIIALKKSKEMDGTGKSLATAGIVISIVATVLEIFILIFSIVTMMAAFSAIGGNYYYMIAAL